VLVRRIADVGFYVKSGALFKQKMMRFTPENIGQNENQKDCFVKRFHDMSRIRSVRVFLFRTRLSGGP